MLLFHVVRRLLIDIAYFSKDLIRYANCSISRELCTYTSVQVGLKLVCLKMDETLTSNDLHVYYC